MRAGRVRAGRVAGVVAAACLSGPVAGALAAGDPVMPLEQVHADMRCSALSVVRGTAISSFGADVVDVVSGSATGEGPRILVRVSGEAVDATGIGPGFSGSPVICPDAHGVPRTIGAISESVGDASNRLALVTPIQAILGERVEMPPVARASRVRLGAVRPLAALSVSGLPNWLADAAHAGARRAGRALVAVPGRPVQGFAPVDLRPGSAMAAGLAEGDLALSAVGTVSYRDGDTIWGFGHPLDGAGARSLFLQDAYVYGIVESPGFLGGSFKLAAPGHVVGTLRRDGPSAVVGRLGAAPRSIPVSVVARDADSGAVTRTRVRVADESLLDEPAGPSALRVAATLATAEGAARALDGAPARETARMCVRITLQRVPAPVGFCNRYVIDGTDTPALDALGGGALLAELTGQDVQAALSEIDANTFARLRVTGVRVVLDVERGLRQAFLERALAPRAVKSGHVARIRARVRRFRGEREWITVPVRIPRDLQPGTHMLALSGAPADTDHDGDLAGVFETLFGADGGPAPKAASLRDLTARLAGFARFDGLSAGFAGGRGGVRNEHPAYFSPARRVSGTTLVPVRVVAR